MIKTVPYFGSKEIFIGVFGHFVLGLLRMAPTLQKLTRFGKNLFFDPSAVDFVQFDEDGQAAHLMFRNGTSTTVQGKDASQMRSVLVGSTEVGANAGPIDIPSETPNDSVHGPTRDDGFVPNLTQILSLGKKKAWFFRHAEDGKHLILACANVGGSCSVRLFDAHTALALGKRYGSGSYREVFSDLIEGATEITVDSQPNLARDCKQRLPERIFAQLKKRIEEIE